MIGPVWHMAGNPYAMSALKKFLDSTQFIIEKCNGLYNTQANESLNRKKIEIRLKRCAVGIFLGYKGYGGGFVQEYDRMEV